MSEIQRWHLCGENAYMDEWKEYGDYVMYEDCLAVVEKLKAQIEVARAEGACEGQHLGFKIGYEDGYSKGPDDGQTSAHDYFTRYK